MFADHVLKAGRLSPMQRILCLMLTVALTAVSHADEATMMSPAKWAQEQVSVWRDNGIAVQSALPDVMVATWPSGHREYLQQLPDTSMTRSDWREAAISESFPDAHQPLNQLARGAMLYQNHLRQLAKASGRPWTEELRDVLATMKSLNMNSVNMVAYFKPEEWSQVEAVLRDQDFRMVLQYHAAMFKPKRGRTHFYQHQVPKAQDMARVCVGSPQLLGFAVREEVYYRDAFWLQEYHTRLLQEAPGLPLYVLHHAHEAAAMPTQPPLRILGTDPYVFTGGYYGRGRQTPSFVAPQAALTGLLRNRLNNLGSSAMRNQSIFAYTMDMQPGVKIFSDDQMRQNDYPLKEFPGVEKLDNGHWLLWRHYEMPENTVKAAIWLSASAGAQAWFPWYYSPQLPDVPDVPDQPVTADSRAYLYAVNSSKEGSNNTRIWKEYAQAMSDMTSIEPWLLNLRRDGFPRFGSDDKLLVGGVLRPLAGGGHAVIITNCDVGRWPNYPQVKMNKKAANLDVDREGNLVGYEPLTQPRAVNFRLRMSDQENVWRLPEGEKLPASATGDGSWHKVSAMLEPGRGQLLFIGTLSQFEQFQKTSR